MLLDSSLVQIILLVDQGRVVVPGLICPAGRSLTIMLGYLAVLCAHQMTVALTNGGFGIDGVLLVNLRV